VTAGSAEVSQVVAELVGGLDDHIDILVNNAGYMVGRVPVASIPLKRGGVPGDVAGAVLFLASDIAAFITGEITGGARFK